MITVLATIALALPQSAPDTAFRIAGGWIVNGTPIVEQLNGSFVWNSGWARPLPNGAGWVGSGLDTLPGRLPGSPWGLATPAPGRAWGAVPEEIPCLGISPAHAPRAEPLPDRPSAFRTNWVW